jgi:uncharacterized protein (DUF952 family)
MTDLSDTEAIYHILPSSDWEDAQTTGLYKPKSLDQEGFIHFSVFDQVIPTAVRYFQGTTDLLLLKVDPKLLITELRYDQVESLGNFPHLYGPLNLDAIIRVQRLVQAENSTSSWSIIETED